MRQPSLQPAMSSCTRGVGSAQLLVSSARGAKLPRLQPNVNKRAQQIIAQHMNSVDSNSSFFSLTQVPVLTQIESTAPRTARTHDISHRYDKGSFLTPCIPASLVKEEDHMYEAGFLPTDTSSVYNERDGLWHTKVFPSSAPSSRTDAVMLDAWITRALERQQETLESLEHGAKEDLAQSVEGLVPILSVALHEIVRQVMHHCAERGVALEKVWRTYVELFHRVLKQMQKSLQDQKQRTAEVQATLGQAREELHELRRSHPEHMHSVIADLEQGFTRRQHEYEDELVRREEENAQLKVDLRTHHRELELWYPGFGAYQDSYIKGHFPLRRRVSLVEQSPKSRLRRMRTARENAMSAFGMGSTNEGARGHARSSDDEEKSEEEIPPEVAIAEDFKRLLAVLAPEKRKAIGQDLSFIMDPNVSPSGRNDKDPRRGQTRGTNRSAKKGGFGREGSQEEGFNASDWSNSSMSLGHKCSKEEENVEELRAEVKQQEERIRALREQIFRLEAEQAAATEAVSSQVSGKVRTSEVVMEAVSSPKARTSEVGLEMLNALKNKPRTTKVSGRHSASPVEDEEDGDGSP